MLGELGRARCDDQIAGQGDLEAPAQCEAIDGGDDPRSRGAVARSSPRGEVLQVVAHAKDALARPRDDRHGLLKVGGELIEDRGQFSL